MSFTHKHLLGIEGLAQSAILEILDKAEKYADLNLKTHKRVDVLAGLTQINMFFENSFFSSYPNSKTVESADSRSNRLL